MKRMRDRNLRIVGLAMAMGLLSAQFSVQAQTSELLPVYQVQQSGATDAQAMVLANALNIPVAMVTQTNGMVVFVDPVKYKAVPTLPVTDSALTNELLAGTQNLYPDTPIAFQAIDFDALASLPVMDSMAATRSVSNALSSAGLMPQYGTPTVGHTRFTAFYTNSSGVVISNSQYLDTQVNYQFSVPGGYPLIGPGAQVQVTFDPHGDVAHALYAARQLAPGPMIPIVSSNEASNRAAPLFPANAQITPQLVYWAPPLLPPQDRTEPWNPATILPYYACSATITLTDAAGESHPLRLKTRLIPATDEPAFVPSINLAVSGGTQVVASVRVAGGMPPYTYSWSGSDPAVSTNSGEGVSYVPIRRIAPPGLSIAPSAAGLTISWPALSDGFVLESSPSLSTPDWAPFTGPVQTTDDMNSVSVTLAGQNAFFRLRLASQTIAGHDAVGVRVTDANGVSVGGSSLVPVQSTPDRPPNPGPNVICYGIESPREPDFAVDRIGWQKAMAKPGGGFQRYCWLGGDSWPGDFIEPNPPGAILSMPWINGSADTFGVNTASIVLNNTDGAPDYFCASMPGANIADYNTARLARPGNPGWTVAANLKNNGWTPQTIHYAINYKGSWGPLGPSDYLNWLLMDCCDALDENGPGGTPPQRWGPAFNGLHILTGFNSGEAVADGSFEYDFAQFILGSKYLPPLPIVGSWFLAAAFAGYQDHGLPAAMGPIGPSAVSDYQDYYWGKGKVNATIAPSKLTGWWYETGP